MENRANLDAVDRAAAELAALGLGPKVGPVRPAAPPATKDQATVSPPASSLNVGALISRARAAKANGDLVTALRCFEAAHRALPEDVALANKVRKIRVRPRDDTRSRSSAPLTGVPQCHPGEGER